MDHGAIDAPRTIVHPGQLTLIGERNFSSPADTHIHGAAMAWIRQ